MPKPLFLFFRPPALWPALQAALTVAGVLGLLWAAPAQAAALRADHPLLGTWKIAVPGLRCEETYFFKPDGTTLVISAREVSEGEFEVSDAPGASGFFQLRDKIVRNNAQPDCTGAVTTPGSEVRRFLRFSPSEQAFLMCDDDNLDACIGPFEREEGEAT